MKNKILLTTKTIKKLYLYTKESNKRHKNHLFLIKRKTLTMMKKIQILKIKIYLLLRLKTK